MLAIRMQRTGRKGHTQFRVVVQDSHFHPTRGRVVAYLGSYNPHSKTAQLDKDLAAKYLGNGAQPSDRVARLLQGEGVKLPDWVKLADPKKRDIKSPEKLRRNRPVESVAEEPAASEEAPVEVTSEEPAAEPEVPETESAPAEEKTEESADSSEA